MNSLRFVQITDTHLFDHADGRLYDLNTAESLAAVISSIRRSRAHIDAILVTGDLTHDGGTPALRRLAHQLGALNAPVHLLPGNHDDTRLFACALKRGGFHTRGSFTLRCWQTVLLDCAVPNAVHGHLRSAELARLDATLHADPGHHALVCLHQQPVPVGSAWLDRHMLDNADALFAILDRHPQVRGVIWGHVHQDFDALRNGVRLLASPSTCIQFRPQCAEFTLDDKPPGWRWLDLHPDGSIETGTEYLSR